MMETIATPRIGRPSTAAPFTRFVISTLMTNASNDSADLLRRARLAGYNGGKTAFYALVAQLRQDHGLESAADRRASEAERRRAERQSEIDRLAREAEERRAREARDREARLAEKARVREERKRGKEAAAAVPEPLLDPNRLGALGRAWLASREATHKSNIDDRSRWPCHLEPAFGDLLPSEVDVPRIRAFVEAKRAAGMTSTTVGRCIGLLSSLFTDLVEREVVARNPVRAVPRALRRLYRDAHDPRTTPFLESHDQIARLRGELSGTLRALFSVGVTTGLRTGELLALEWADVNFTLNRILVQRRLRMGRIDTPESGRGRPVPLAAGAVEVLRDQRAATGDTRLVFPPVPPRRFVDMATLRTEWREALTRAGLPPMRFYDATRHTFASQWVLRGLPIEKLSKILGHSSVVTTERYAHLKPEALTVPDVVSFGTISGCKPDGEL